MTNKLDDTALRAAIDLRDAYDASLTLWRDQDALVGRMTWKTIRGRDYLYHVHGNAGNGVSLGPRSTDTEAQYEAFRSAKSAIKQQLADTEPDLRRAAAVYTALGLPVVDSWAAKLFQHLDRAGLLGTHVMVVGTNALPAYQLEAQVRSGPRIHATRDTDVAWTAAEPPGEAMLWPALREFDPGFRVNMERPFQAIGRGARELEVLVAPSRRPTLADEPFDPALLPEQEWLLLGKPVRHVVSSLDRTPTALVVPDPRFFALQKSWLSYKPDRDPLKAPKDRRQAELVWSWLPEMPRHPLDAAFLASIPSELKDHRLLLDSSRGKTRSMGR